MIIWDANVLIAHLDRRDGLHDQADHLLRQLASEPFGASVATLAEVLVGPARADRLQEAQAALDRLAVAPVPLDTNAASVLAKLRARTGLRLPDCCVLLAGHSKEGAVASFDRRLVLAAKADGLQTYP